MAVLHIPVFLGTLKIRHRRHLRSEERDGKVRVWRLGSYRVAWWPRGMTPSNDHPPRLESIRGD